MRVFISARQSLLTRALRAWSSCGVVVEVRFVLFLALGLEGLVLLVARQYTSGITRARRPEAVFFVFWYPLRAGKIGGELRTCWVEAWKEASGKERMTRVRWRIPQFWHLRDESVTLDSRQLRAQFDFVSPRARVLSALMQESCTVMSGAWHGHPHEFGDMFFFLSRWSLLLVCTEGRSRGGCSESRSRRCCGSVPRES